MHSLATVAVLVTALAACGGDSETGGVAKRAATALGVPATSLRVTSRSDLDSEQFRFYQVTAPWGPSMIVVAPRDGALFDDRTPDAFTRVCRGENAVAHLSQIGAERVAAWFGALGGRACPPPPVDQPHFATVVHKDDGAVEIGYRSQARTCFIELAADGALRGARTVTAAAANTGTTHWKSDARN